jgi:hypothetical protein
MGITEVVTAPRSPWQNAYVERVIGSIRRECLDHVVVINEEHPRRVLFSYVDYYHRSRTHLSLEKDCPDPRLIQPPNRGKVIRSASRRASPPPRTPCRLIRFRGLRNLQRSPLCGGPSPCLQNPHGEHQLPRLTSAIGDQLVRFIAPHSPQPRNLTRDEVLRRHSGPVGDGGRIRLRPAGCPPAGRHRSRA